MAASRASEKVKERQQRQRELEEEKAMERILGAAAQLKEKAESGGVLAYLLKPITRERPNERFLQNTLRSVDYANRRADESEMWERLDMARERERRERRERSQRIHQRHGLASRDTAEDTTETHRRRRPVEENAEEEEETEAAPRDTAGPSAVSDNALDSFLASKRIRGRGGVGSRIEEAGPYLPAPGPGQSLVGGDKAALPTCRPQQGPMAPGWMLRAKTSDTDSSASDSSSSANSDHGDSARGVVATKMSSKRKDRKRKGRGKVKQEKRRKHKKLKSKDKDKKRKKDSKQRREKRSEG